MPVTPKSSRPNYLAPKQTRKPKDSIGRTIHKTTRWRLTSQRKRMESPLCEVCGAKGDVVAATQVDHIIRLEDNGSPYYPSNLMSICTMCHQDKNALEARGYRPAYMVTDDGHVPSNKANVIQTILTGKAHQDDVRQPKGRGGDDLWI